MERQLKKAISDKMVPQQARAYLNPQLKQVIGWLYAPDGRWGEQPLQARMRSWFPVCKMP